MPDDTATPESSDSGIEPVPDEVTAPDETEPTAVVEPDEAPAPTEAAETPIPMRVETPIAVEEGEAPKKRLTRDERAAAGKAARERAPLESHGQFEPAADRDPVGLLLKQAETRVPELVPVRHGRMLVSPFSFFRGAALPMAFDLSTTPTSGLKVQLCGDAHLSNFGLFASPERRVIFDVNDFDETLPGPFEWDLKRLAASLVVAGRENGFSAKDRRRVVLAAIGQYQGSMREFAAMPLLEVWYAHLEVQAVIDRFRKELKAARIEQVQATIAKARTRDSMQVLAKMTADVDGERRIIADPPLVVPIEDLSELDPVELYAWLRDILRAYRRSLQPDRRHLLDQYRLVHIARKVVGVGSVGTRAWMLLMQAGDDDALFLQAKEAQASVLSGYLGKAKQGQHGQRVVEGQRLMQAVSDIFLGWQRVQGPSGQVDYYFRQLRDWKMSAAVEEMIPSGMSVYSQLCAWTLARAHARSGDRVAIAAYIGKSERFAEALAEFAELYADQNERDYAALTDAVASGRAQAVHGL